MIKKLFLFALIILSSGMASPAAAQLSSGAPLLVTVDSLLTAVRTNNLAGVRDLLRRGMEINTTDPNGTSLLMIAAWEGHVQMVDFLLAQGARVQRRNNVAGSSACADAVDLAMRLQAMNPSEHRQPLARA